MRRLLLALSCVVAASATLCAQDSAYPSSDEIKARYGFAAWPGATGSVFAGLPASGLAFVDSSKTSWQSARMPFVEIIDIREERHERTTPIIGHASRRHFQIAVDAKDIQHRYLNVDIVVADSRLAARTALLNRFLAIHNMVPRPRPELPWGHERRNDIGDVAFQSGRGDEVHRLFFVRGNVAVSIQAFESATSVAVDYARHLDRQITAGPSASSLTGLSLPSPQRFELATTATTPGQPVLLDLVLGTSAVFGTTGAELNIDWRLPHGDLVRNVARRGDLGYLARQSGDLTLYVIDDRGRFQGFTKHVTLSP